MNWIGAAALSEWNASTRRLRSRVDVMLLTHPRDSADLNRALPWARLLNDHERDSLVHLLRPSVAEIVEAPRFTVGLLLLPLLASDIISGSPTSALEIVSQGLRMAGAAGARFVCLGGLTGALTLYGELIHEEARSLGITIATGHCATASSIVHALRRAEHDLRLDVRDGRATVLGVGSVGAAVARLLVSSERRPAEMWLVDRPNRRSRVERLAAELSRSGTLVRVETTNADGTLPDTSACYASQWLVSAISVPGIVDIGRVAPNTVLIDDSQPYCWDRVAAWKRCSERQDIAPCDAGLVDCAAIGYRGLFPFDFADHGPNGSETAWSCVTEGLLCHLVPELTPTLGEPQLKHLLEFDEAFGALGLRTPPLQCGEHLLPIDALARSMGDGQRKVANG